MHIIFAIVGIIFLILDFKKNSAVKLACSTTAMFGAIISYKFPANYLLIIMFCILGSIFNYFIIKAVLKKEELKKQKISKLNECIGKIALVKKDIGKTLSINGLGLVEYNSELYSARSVDDKEILKDKKVEIISHENTILNVKVVKNADK